MPIINEAKTSETLIQTIKGLFDSNKTDDSKDYLNGSISDYTKNLVMTFPILCDDSISPKTASMISKANERNITTMLRMLFTSMNINADSGLKAIEKIHKNIKLNSDIYDISNKIDDIANIDVKDMVSKIDVLLNNGIFRNEAEAVKAINEANKMNKKAYPVNSLSESSLNRFSVLSNRYGNTYIREDVVKNNNATTEKPIVDSVSKLMDDDVKKSNDLQPTLLSVNYIDIDPSNKSKVERTFLAGVKSRLIKVNSGDIVERLISKNRTKISFLNFIRATTGEIGFFRDFLLSLDQAKLDSKNAVKKGPAAEMWNLLAYRSAKNNKNKLFRSKNYNDASAITVLVVSQETVNSMKKYYKFDLEKISNTKMIMDAYNLMGIIIADDSIEVIKTFYAGNELYEEKAYSYLEKETDSSYKKVINLIGSMNSR